MTLVTSNRKRCALDERKRKLILAVISNGSSRRVAAQRAGCAASTVTRTAARDPKFALDLLQAEHSAEMILLRRIQAAAEDPKHWRAAAWLLERRNAEDFFLRAPNLVTEEQLRACLAQFVAVIHEDLPHKNYRRIVHKLRKLSRECDAVQAPIIIDPDDDWETERPQNVAGANAPTRPDSHCADNAGLACATLDRQKEYDSGPNEIDATESDLWTSDDERQP